MDCAAKAKELDPKNAIAYNNRGIARSDLGRHKEAIKDYDEAILLDPNFVAAYKNRGTAKSKLGRHEEAEKDYDEAILFGPKTRRLSATGA